jgi:diguanylate cyclase (GGDEF)-like protein
MEHERRPRVEVHSISGLTRPERSALIGALVLIASVAALAAAHVLLGAGGATVDAFIRTWGGSLVYMVAAFVVAMRAVRVVRQRAAWAALAVGLSVYGLGNVVWMFFYDDSAAPPIPSLSDGLWLALYPASYAGLVLLARERRSAAPVTVWLDGLVAGLGFAGLGAAVVIGPLLASGSGGTIAVVTNLTYPVCDLLLVALVLGLSAHRGWHLDRVWSLLGLGFVALYVADSMYLLQVAGGDAQVSTGPNLFYLSGVVLLALAAWAPASERETPGTDRWLVLLPPGAFVAISIGVLLYDHFSPLALPALVFATLTLIAAIVRTGFTFHDVRTLAVTRVQATTDELTSLPNRRLFMAALGQRIAVAQAADDSAAVLLIDLDHFKELNDTLGHRAGDLLLRQVGPRVRDALGEQDVLARLGGDEFGVVLASPADADSARRVAERIGAVLRQPCEIEGLQLRVAASVGIALFPLHAQDAEQLLSRADVAMYQAKRDRAGHALYAADRDGNSRDNLALAAELPGAIASGQLKVHFQAKADTATRHVVGMEALVRWEHPERGLLAPVAFIGVAEQAGLMRELTRAVIGDALSACRQWHDAGHQLHVSVNVSFNDLMDAGFPLEVMTALAQHGLEPSWLVVEVTESSIMSDAEQIGDVLTQLSESGVQISLDDFGTGYSSLSHLRTLPVSEVKIDRSFVARMGSDLVDEAIVRSTIQLAHDLGIRVAAEGVEDDATWTALGHLGCELVQGYYLSRPLQADAVEAFLDSNQSDSRPRPVPHLGSDAS